LTHKQNAELFLSSGLPVIAFASCKGDFDYTLLSGTRQGVLILFAGIGTIGKTCPPTADKNRDDWLATGQAVCEQRF
jgi:hypothetical protein